MKFLIFDTETTGLPPKDAKNVSLVNFQQWPRVVSLSFIVYDSDTKFIKLFDKIVRLPDDVEMTEETVALHGITKEMSLNQGLPILDVLNEFLEQYYFADVVIGHNVQFDVNMVMSELYRVGADSLCNEGQIQTYIQHLAIDLRTRNSKIYCTMKAGKDICAIKAMDKLGKAYIKSPRLIELYRQLFGENDQATGYKLAVNKLHNSLIDVLVTFRCFYQIQHNVDICREDTSIGELWLLTMRTSTF